MASKQDRAAKELQSFLKRAQEELDKLEDQGKGTFEGVTGRKESAQEFVRKHPLLSAGGALVVGYFLGRLFKRGRR